MHVLWLLCTLAPAAPLPNPPLPLPPLQLHLDQVTLGAMSSDPEPYMLISCEVRWINATGAPLEASTSFGSVFDGLSLVVYDKGQEVVRQQYIYHQSPYADARPLVLAEGQTRKTLLFPLTGIQLRESAHFRLEGALIGNDQAGTYTTPWRTMQVLR